MTFEDVKRIRENPTAEDVDNKELARLKRECLFKNDGIERGREMKEILFRGKRVDNGEWVNGWFVGAVNKTIFSPAEKSAQIIDKDLYWHEVIPETVGQYTGLTDKNGIKIFEGDIIKFGINQRVMYVHWNEETLTWELTDMGVSACEVNHLFNTFDLGEIQVESAYGEMFSEVVGNIHDNPELLESEVQGE